MELGKDFYNDLWAVIAEKETNELEEGEKTVKMYADERSISVGAARDRLQRHFGNGIVTRRKGLNNAWIYKPVAKEERN